MLFEMGSMFGGPVHSTAGLYICTIPRTLKTSKQLHVTGVSFVPRGICITAEEELQIVLDVLVPYSIPFHTFSTSN